MNSTKNVDKNGERMSRRASLKIAALTTFSLFFKEQAIAQESMDSQEDAGPVRLITADGEVMEVDRQHLPRTRSKGTMAAIRKWMGRRN